MFIIKYRKIFYTLSALLVGLSIFATFTWGIKFGIDFTGGSVLEVKYSEQRATKEEVISKVNSANLNLGDYSIKEFGSDSFIIKTRNITDAEKNVVLSVLRDKNKVEEVRFNNVGSTLGQELRSKSVVSVLLVVLTIILFVAFAFRRVSKPVSSWSYGLITIITFIHDVIIPVGLFSFLGHFAGVEVDTLFIIAILVVLGYSINDTIVVFDRIRENLGHADEKERENKFEALVGKSLISTVGRSINTSLTTVLSLLAIYFIGGEVTKYFALAMLVGVIVGTYSSIFLSAPLLVTIYKRHEAKK